MIDLLAEDRVTPLGQEENLDLVSEALMTAIEPLPASEAGLALIACGLDILPAGRCLGHYRAALLQVRAEVDRLVAELEERPH
jgi:hypothetical protein